MGSSCAKPTAADREKGISTDVCKVCNATLAWRTHHQQPSHCEWCKSPYREVRPDYREIYNDKLRGR